MIEWEHDFGDFHSTRLTVGCDLNRWLVGIAFAQNDIMISLLCFYIAVDWFTE